MQKQGFTLQLFFNQPVAQASFLLSQDSWCGGRGFIHSADVLKSPCARLCTKAASWSPQFTSIQSLSRVQLFLTPWTAAPQASLSITDSQKLPKLMSIESVMPSNHLILCHPLPLPPSIFISVFSNESALHIRWPKYWSFSFSISPSNEYWGLISFRMDWLDLLAVQGTRKSLLQHHSSKAPQILLGRPEQMSQTGWLQTVEHCSLTLWRSEVQNEGAARHSVWILQGILLASPSSRWLPAVLAFLSVHAAVALRSLPPHITRSLPCASSSCLLHVSKFSLSEDTRHRIRAHPNPGSPDLMLVTSAKTLSPNKVTGTDRRNSDLNLSWGGDTILPMTKQKDRGYWGPQETLSQLARLR